MEVAVEAGFQARVGVDELVHQAVVASDDDDEVLAVILHGLQERVDGLQTEVVFGFGVQAVGLVDEQHAAECALDHLRRLGGRLSHVARDQTGAVHLHQMTLGKDAQGAVDAGHHARDGGLAGAGIAGKHHVQRHVHGFQAVLLAQLVHRDHVDQVVDLALDAVQADQRVQLRLQILDVLHGQRLLLRILLGGGLFRSLLRRIHLFRRLLGRIDLALRLLRAGA